MTSDGSGTIVLSGSLYLEGSYDVSVEIRNEDCTSAVTKDITLSNPETPELDPISDHVVCGASYTLSTITGRYLRTPNYYTDSSYGTSIDVGHVYGVGTLDTTIYVYDSAGPGCEAETSFYVHIPPAIVLDPVADKEACVSDALTLGSITGTGLNSPKYYDADPTLGLANEILPTEAFTTVGTRRVYVYDEHLDPRDNSLICSDLESFTVTIYANPVVDRPSVDPVYCDVYTLESLSSGTYYNVDPVPSDFKGTQATPITDYDIRVTTDLWVYKEQLSTLGDLLCYDVYPLTVHVDHTPTFTITTTDPPFCGDTGTISLLDLLPNTDYDIFVNVDLLNITTITPTHSLKSDALGRIGLVDIYKDGQYDITLEVKDENCTSDTLSITLIEPPTPTLTLLQAIDPSTCEGSDGQVQLATTDLPNGLYTVTSTFGDLYMRVTDNFAVIDNLKEGDYKDITVTYLSCVSIDDIDVYLSDPPIPTLTNPIVTNPSTCEGSDGQIRLTTEHLPDRDHHVTYTFTGVSGIARSITTKMIVKDNIGIIPNLLEGSYENITVTYLNCVSVEDVDLELSDPPTPTLTWASQEDPTTCGGNDGYIQYITTDLPDGEHQVYYQFTDIRNRSEDISGTLTVRNNVGTLEGLSEGRYNYLYVVYLNCYSEHQDAVILIDPVPPESPVLSEAVYCSRPIQEGLIDPNLQATYNQLDSDLEVRWYEELFDIGTEAYVSGEIFNTLLEQPGVYTRFATVYNKVTLCESDFNYTTITINQSPEFIKDNIMDDGVLRPYKAVDLNKYQLLLVDYNDHKHTYQVTDIETGENIPTDSDGVFKVPHSSTYGIYALDEVNKCDVYEELEIDFIDIEIPNVFSPGGNYADEELNYWYPDNLIARGQGLFYQEFDRIEVMIFDRYGRLITQFTGIRDKRTGGGWDGTYEGIPMPSGDYWYHIIVNDSKGREFTGHFNLYRE